MFTGIIEGTGVLEAKQVEGSNIDLTFSSPISEELKIDQSLAHDGVCLTVVKKNQGTHTVTAIKETLDRTNLGQLRVGEKVNLERAMAADSRFDGHLVQGHVDSTGICESIKNNDGSWDFRFSYPATYSNMLVDKGSICVNGVSLTLVNPDDKSFGVSIIPYTYQNTSFGQLKVGDKVNLEFDIIGKYVAKMLQPHLK